jgi:hypothetical protein
MGWERIPIFNVRVDSEEGIKRLVEGVGEFIKENQPIEVVRSTDLSKKPRVTAISLDGNDFLLSEETYPHGSEGRRVGTGYSANIFYSRDQFSPEILYGELRRILRETNPAPNVGATA